MNRIIILITFLLLSLSSIAQEDSLIQNIPNPTSIPPNYIEIASTTEITEKQDQSYKHSLRILRAFQTNDETLLNPFIPTLEDAITFMTVSYWSNEQARKSIMKDLEGWQLDLVNRISDSFTNIRNEANQKGFDWKTSEIINIDNALKKNSQFPGGEVKIFLKDAKGIKFMVRIGSLFEIEGKWMLVNQFLTQ